MLKKRPQQEIDWTIPAEKEEADQPQPSKVLNWFRAIVESIVEFL